MPEAKKKPGKPGNPAWKKGMKSPNPRGKAIGREYLVKEITEAMQHALETAHPEGAKGYMVEIAREKPALFVAMLQKVMPNEVAVTATISLGDAMAEANARLAAYEAKMIDVTPEQETNNNKHLANAYNQAGESGIDLEHANSLKDKET